MGDSDRVTSNKSFKFRNGVTICVSVLMKQESTFSLGCVSATKSAAFVSTALESLGFA